MVADEWNDDKSAANVRADTLLSDNTESSKGDAEIGAASGECPPRSPQITEKIAICTYKYLCLQLEVTMSYSAVNRNYGAAGIGQQPACKMRLRVQCYAGWKGDERPMRFHSG
jgi:hypothetical protein